MSRLIIPTNLSYLDKALGGGQFACGVHGILGPTGGGKSHLSTMIAVSGATGGSVFSSVTNTQKLWVLFDLGSSGKVSITRAICNAARSSGTFQSPYSDKTDCIETNCSDDLPRDEKGKLLTSKMRIEIAIKKATKSIGYSSW